MIYSENNITFNNVVPGKVSVGIGGPLTAKTKYKLNEDGIAVRSGHHCAQPLLKHYGFKNAIRASIGIYNTREEIDTLVNSLMKMR